jgi:AraC-like DNA-binding protein
MKKESSKTPFKLYTRSGGGIIISSHYSDDAMEIAEVVSGRVRFQIGTVFFEAAEGELIFVPPTMVFRADAVSDFAAVRGVSFNSSILEANMDKIDVDILYMFYVQAKNKISVFKSEHPVHSTLAKYMQNSHDEDGSKEVCYKLPIRANIYLMMTELLRYYCGSKDELDRMIYHNVMRLRPVVEYIAEHYNEKLTIEKLSDIITVSPDYFTKIFKESMGKTPIDYINTVRINRAMRYLSDTEMSMLEIADEIGFCNPNYFHKIFKQYMNSSPLAYRKAAK